MPGPRLRIEAKPRLAPRAELDRPQLDRVGVDPRALEPSLAAALVEAGANQTEVDIAVEIHHDRATESPAGDVGFVVPRAQWSRKLRGFHSQATIGDTGSEEDGVSPKWDRFMRPATTASGQDTTTTARLVGVP